MPPDRARAPHQNTPLLHGPRALRTDLVATSYLFTHRPAWSTEAWGRGDFRREQAEHDAEPADEPLEPDRDFKQAASQSLRYTVDDAAQVDANELAGEGIRAIVTTALDNGASSGGLKVITDDRSFAVRPSGTEDVYKLCAESLRDGAHLERMQVEAQALVARLFAQASIPSRTTP